jgi:hypothetical protein
MARRRKPPERADDGSHLNFAGLSTLGRREMVEFARAVGPRVVFYSVVAAGAFYAMAHGANVIWCAGFGAYITGLFELSDWLRRGRSDI